MKQLHALNNLACAVVVVASLNMSVASLFGQDVLGGLLNSVPYLSQAFYALVGLSALLLAWHHFACGSCKS